MDYSTKGMKKFYDEDDYDVTEFLNDNIDILEGLLIVDLTVNTINDLPTPSSQYENKTAKILSDNSIRKCKSINNTYVWLSMPYTIVTIPTTGYTEETDGTNNYYTIEIDVIGVDPTFNGTDKIDYVRPDPYTVDDNETYKGLFALITDAISETNKIKFFLSEEPTQPFDIYIYGV